jgi:hypothetical protein
MKETVQDAGDYYTLTFDPPKAEFPDEYHELTVRVDKPKVAVRTNSEYYDPPTFYDEPEAREKIAVDRLPQVLETLRTLSDSEAAKRLSGMELSARLSSANPAELRSLVHGKKANEAFTVLANRSAFLPPPAAEIADAPAPAVQEQRRMLDRTIHYLQETLLRLPDLFATRTTVRYEEPAQKKDQTWKIAAADQSLHPVATESVTVLVRNSKETTEGDARAANHQHGRERSLIAEGTFGPMLAQVLVDVADPHSQLKWGRWERDAQGQRAVFRYVVPREFAHFEVSFCCLADPDGTVPFNTTAAYHGEITIDPETGAVYRITAEADLLPRLPIDRSEVMVSKLHLPRAKRFNFPVSQGDPPARLEYAVRHLWSVRNHPKRCDLFELPPLRLPASHPDGCFTRALRTLHPVLASCGSSRCRNRSDHGFESP